MRVTRALSYASITKGALLSSFVALYDRNTLTAENATFRTDQPAVTRSYSNVILGFGTTGTAAVEQLLKFGHPLDSILVVDPQIRLKTFNFNPKTEKRLTFDASLVANIDAAHKIVQLSDGSRIRYQNCLISVGSASAPYHPQFVDEDCDLHRTVVDLTHLNAPYELYRTITNDPGGSAIISNGLISSNRSESKSIALVGANSFETIELSGKLAIAAAQKHVNLSQALQQRVKPNEKPTLSAPPPPMRSAPKSAKTTNNSSHNSVNKSALQTATQAKAEVPFVPKDTVMLVYPAYGPMSHSLPRYLSLAVAKRLQALGVQLVPYSYVRYLGAADSAIKTTKGTNGTNRANSSYSTSNNTSSTKNETISPQAVLFLAKTYDSLNTISLVADKVAFAPTSVPTNADRKVDHSIHSMYRNEKVPVHCAVKANLSHPHSFILRSGLELDSITGGVVVNQSLQACEGLYVAGDVASVCSGGNGVDLSGTVDDNTVHTSGSSVLQQRGVIRGYQNALYSGTVAGRNMAYNSTRSSPEVPSCTPLLYNHIPVYEAHSADIGVHFTFIGNCSTALESHGYWWKLSTNANHTTTTETNKDVPLKPPLGLGVVFYVDSSDIINGILISGLPTITSTSSAEVNDSHKAKYIQRVNQLCKQLIGKTVKSLEFAINSNNGSNNGSVTSSGAYKRINLGESFLTAPENELLPPDESDRHASNTQLSDTTNTSNTTTFTDSASLSTNNDTNDANHHGTEVYTSQALSWEARRLLSPVLTPALYKNTVVTTDENLNTTMKGLPPSNALLHAVQQYPRPLYRYCGPSHTTIKDLSEPHKDAIVRPTVSREQLFQPEFANTGSRADNLQTAYKRSMAKNLF